MARILFVCSTVDGHTLQICRRLQEIAEAAGHDTTLATLTAHEVPSLAGFDRIVIGASVRYGKHRPEVARFIDDNEALLSSTPSAFFSVNAVARKPEKQNAATNPYVAKFLRQISWQPAIIGIFAGKIDYPKYNLLDKSMIRLIMWMTKGPTDPNGVFEFTDWARVDEFGESIAGVQFGQRAPAAGE